MLLNEHTKSAPGPAFIALTPTSWPILAQAVKEALVNALMQTGQVSPVSRLRLVVSLQLIPNVETGGESLDHLVAWLSYQSIRIEMTAGRTPTHRLYVE